MKVTGIPGWPLTLLNSTFALAYNYLYIYII